MSKSLTSEARGSIAIPEAHHHRAENLRIAHEVRRFLRHLGAVHAHRAHRCSLRQIKRRQLPTRERSWVPTSTAVWTGDDLKQMTVWVFKIDAPAAIMVIDFVRTCPARVGPVGQLPFTNAAEDLIERNLSTRPTKIAYIDGRGSYTYADLAERVNRCAGALAALGVPMEARVLVCLLDTIDFPAVFLGAVKAGIVPVAVNTLLTAADFDFMLRDSRAQALIEETAQQSRELRPNTEVEVSWEVPPDLQPLHTDPIKLKVVLKNLIGNALKFTTEGSITVAARSYNGGVEFSVSDTGVGIPQDCLAKIFEPFFQLEPGQRSSGSTGLGLSVVQRIVQLLGGAISVESEPGAGSTFTARVRRKMDDVPRAEAAAYMAKQNYPMAKLAADNGVTTVNSIAEAVSGAEAVITMLPSGKHLLDAYDEEHGDPHRGAGDDEQPAGAVHDAGGCRCGRPGRFPEPG